MAGAEPEVDMVMGNDESEDEGQGAEASQSTKACKHPCLKCTKSVTKKAVRCNTCYLWVHVKCANISTELYNILRNPAKFGCGQLSWIL